MKFFSVLVIIMTSCSLIAQIPASLLTVPEKTNYDSTSKSQDVINFIHTIKAKSNLVFIDTLFTTKNGKKSLFVVMANPKISSSDEAKKSGKPVIYFQGNIHAGEVEGKEAMMILMREMLFGNKKHLLNNQIIIFAPNYNPDGNDKMSEKHRTSQEHCPHRVGARRSGGDYDLNRDGIKIEALETQGLFKNIILKWNPDLFVDMHTTNGTWHGNELTYAHSYHYAGHPATSDYSKKIMLPAIKKNMLDKYHLHTDCYGGYSFKEGWPPKNFYTYNHHPRYLVNQFGLRNKMAILSETFAHDKFYHRINSAHKFAVEILEFTNAHGKQIQDVNRKAEMQTIEKIKNNAGKFKNGVRFKMVPNVLPMTLRTYDYLAYLDSTGKTRYARSPTVIEVENVNNHSSFDATVSATVPAGYIIPAELHNVIQKLREHGVMMKQLQKDQKFSGEEFMISELKVSGQLFEHHNRITLEGDFVAKSKTCKKGDYHVEMTQALANLIFYLLEPQSDDGLVHWNFFDKYLNLKGIQKNKVAYPVFKYW
jgi:hypothetical protein